MADSIAYVLKGYPRISELFIASEIWRLEQLGVKIRIFVLKPPDEDLRHAIIDDIAATPTYLPAFTSLSASSLIGWLWRNRRAYTRPLVREGFRHPARLARAVGAAAVQSVRGRKGWLPRKIYVKELLQAVMVVDLTRGLDDVGHLHAHFAHGATTVTWFASMLTGLPFSFTGHAKDIYEPSLNPGGLLARKMRDARFVTTCTNANIDHLEQVEPRADVRLLYHGLNADFSRRIGDGDEPCCTPPSRPARLVSVGRLVPKKGFDVLIEAMAMARDNGIDAELVIAGEPGSHEPVVRQVIRDHGLEDRVDFVGVQSQTQLLDIYRAATAFVLACRVADNGDRDGIPNVLMEAMAAGLPVISTAVSGIPELITDGLDGLLVPPEDPPALAQAIGRVVVDNALAVRLAAAAKTTIADRFDGDALAGDLVALFQTSLADTSGAR